MSDNLKFQKIKIIIIEKFVILFVKDSSKTIQGVFYALQKQDLCPIFGALSNQSLCHLGSVANRTQIVSENKIRNKKQLFGLRQKHLSYNSI